MAVARVLATNLGFKANHGDLHLPCAAAEGGKKTSRKMRNKRRKRKRKKRKKKRRKKRRQTKRKKMRRRQRRKRKKKRRKRKTNRNLSRNLSHNHNQDQIQILNQTHQSLAFGVPDLLLRSECARAVALNVSKAITRLNQMSLSTSARMRVSTDLAIFAQQTTQIGQEQSARPEVVQSVTSPSLSLTQTS